MFLLQMISHVPYTTKKSDVIQFLTTHIRMMNVQDFSLTRTKKKPIGLLGSSYHNQETLNKTNVDAQIKIFGILFIYDRHKREEFTQFRSDVKVCKTL